MNNEYNNFGNQIPTNNQNNNPVNPGQPFPAGINNNVVQPVQPQPIVEPVQPVQPQPIVEPVQPVQPQPIVEPVQPVQPQPVQPVQSVQQPVQPVQPQPIVEPVQPVQPQPNMYQQPLYNAPQQPMQPQYNNYQQQVPKRNGAIIGIIIGIIAVVAIVGGVLFYMNNKEENVNENEYEENNNSKDKNESKNDNNKSNESATSITYKGYLFLKLLNYEYEIYDGYLYIYGDDVYTVVADVVEADFSYVKQNYQQLVNEMKNSYDINIIDSGIVTKGSKEYVYISYHDNEYDETYIYAITPAINDSNLFKLYVFDEDLTSTNLDMLAVTSNVITGISKSGTYSYSNSLNTSAKFRNTKK